MVDWMKIESDMNLNPKEMADMAGVTLQMYYAVRKGRRKFTNQVHFRLFFHLASSSNFEGRAALLNEALRVVNRFEKSVI